MGLVRREQTAFAGDFAETRAHCTLPGRAERGGSSKARSLKRRICSAESKLPRTFSTASNKQVATNLAMSFREHPFAVSFSMKRISWGLPNIGLVRIAAIERCTLGLDRVSR